MRHKFRFVRSPPFIEFTVEILFWNNETERRAPIRGQAQQLAEMDGEYLGPLKKMLEGKLDFVKGKQTDGELYQIPLAI